MIVSQLRFPRHAACTAHIYGSRGCGVGLMGKTKTWAADSSITMPHMCKTHSTMPILPQISCIQQLQFVLYAVKDPWPSHAVG